MILNMNKGPWTSAEIKEIWIQDKENFLTKW